MKTQEELSALKKEVETLRGKLSELTEDELAAVTGGAEVGTIGGSFGGGHFGGGGAHTKF